LNIIKLIEHIEILLEKPHGTWLGEPMLAIRVSEAQQLTRALRIAVKALETVKIIYADSRTYIVADEALKEINADGTP